MVPIIGPGEGKRPTLMAVAPAAAAMASPAGFRADGLLFAARGGEGGEFLAQFGRPAMRALGPAPIGGPQQDFAVSLAFRTMKLVDWHRSKIFGSRENSRRQFGTEARRAFQGFLNVAIMINCRHESLATRR